MTEKEKAKNGELYNPMYDKELIQERFNVKDLCFKYNNTLPSNMNEKQKILKEILPNVNTNPYIEQPFICDYGYNIEIGDNFYSNHNLIILDTTTVKIGNNVWIGGNVVILPGVTIGDNSIIGAGSIVTKDIPANVIAVGNPCKVKRKIAM